MFIQCLPGLRRFAAVLIAALIVAPTLAASDHADPIRLGRMEGGITDLFAFPAKDLQRKLNGKPVTGQEANQLMLVLCVRRSLTTSPPYPGLDEFKYVISLDTQSALRFDDELERQRYGGLVVKPEAIAANLEVEIQLNNDTSYKELLVRQREGNRWVVKCQKQGTHWGREKHGQWEPRGQPFELYSGVRDDPFIFPMFFGTNVVAMVIPLPLSYFPGADDFLIWATSSRHGVQIDHVGRSQRTQLPRFDLLNTIHPSQHIAALRAKDSDPGLLDDFLRTQIRPTFNLRPYDFQPDVMIFTRRPEYAPHFPNGRQLEDDVAFMTAMSGDCQLYELSFAVRDPQKYKATHGRPTKNDKEFSEMFPFLAEPWPDRTPTPPPDLTMKNQVLVAGIGVALAAFLLLPWFLYFRVLKRLRAVPGPTGPRQQQPSAHSTRS